MLVAYLVAMGVDDRWVALSPLGPSQNARFYGISNLLEGGSVEVVARRRDDRLEITVANPKDADGSPRKGTGLGIENVRRRLLAVYGDAAHLGVRSEPTRFQVDLQMPASNA